MNEHSDDSAALAAALVNALLRIDAVTYNRGHGYRPIAPEDVPLIERANAGDPRFPRSLRCWDCSADDDKPVNPATPDGPTWGDHAHERREAWSEAIDLLARLSGS